jgi:hypothetical protein
VRHHFIIDSAATLLGVALVIVTAVRVTGKAETTISDELAFGAALLFLGSCGASHLAITRENDGLERLADRIFAGGLLVLLASVLGFWF